MGGDELVAELVGLVLRRVRAAPGDARYRAVVDALAALRTTGVSLHAFSCEQLGRCPAADATARSDRQLEEMSSALLRELGTGGLPQ